MALQPFDLQPPELARSRGTVDLVEHDESIAVRDILGGAVSHVIGLLDERPPIGKGVYADGVNEGFKIFVEALNRCLSGSD